MKTSKEFMLLFRFQPDLSHQQSEAEAAAEHQQWGTFIGNLAIQERLVSTYQLGFEGRQISADSKIIDGVYVSESGIVGGNMVITANSLDEAVEIGKACPVLGIGGTVEIREINPIN